MSNFEQARPFVFLSYCLKTLKISVHVDGENEVEKGERPDPSKKTKTNDILAVFKIAKSKSPA